VNLVRIIIPILVIALTGCTKNIQNKEAVKKAVMEHLAQMKSLSLSNMDVDVASVNFKDKEAEALVRISPKGGDPSAGMQIGYILDQKGGQWVVRKKADAGASPHGGMSMPAPETKAPLSHPPLPSGDSGPAKQ